MLTQMWDLWTLPSWRSPHGSTSPSWPPWTTVISVLFDPVTLMRSNYCRKIGHDRRHLAGAGVLRNWLLQPLAEACAEEGRYKFILTISLLRVLAAPAPR